MDRRPHLLQLLEGRTVCNELICKKYRRSYPAIIASSPALIQSLARRHTLQGHKGCVNTICWNTAGNKLVSGSDDTTVRVWDATNNYKQIACAETGHSNNIFSAKFVPETNDSRVVSCGADGEVRLVNLERKDQQQATLLYSKQRAPIAYRVEFHPAFPSVFLSTHQDGIVNLFDLRAASNRLCPLLQLRSTTGARDTIGISNIVFSPVACNNVVLGCSDVFVRLFDFRYSTGPDKRFHCVQQYCPRSLVSKKTRSHLHHYHSICVTGVAVNKLQEIAATYSGGSVYVWRMNPTKNECTDLHFETSEGIWVPPTGGTINSNMSSVGSVYSDTSASYYCNPLSAENWFHDGVPVCTKFLGMYSGHRNQATFLKQVQFMGPEGDYVCSGSDDGHVYIWDKHSTKIIQLLKGDEDVVNCISPHHTLPCMAVSGLENDIKVFQPTDKVTFDEAASFLLMEANLQEAKAETIGTQTNIILQNSTTAGSAGSGTTSTTCKGKDDPPPPPSLAPLAPATSTGGCVGTTTTAPTTSVVAAITPSLPLLAPAVGGAVSMVKLRGSNNPTTSGHTSCTTKQSCTTSPSSSSSSPDIPHKLQDTCPALPKPSHPPEMDFSQVSETGSKREAERSEADTDTITNDDPTDPKGQLVLNTAGCTVQIDHTLLSSITIHINTRNTLCKIREIEPDGTDIYPDFPTDWKTIQVMNQFRAENPDIHTEVQCQRLYQLLEAPVDPKLAIDISNTIRKRGNDHFKARAYPVAARKYSKALRFLLEITEAKKTKEFHSAALSCHSNLSAVYLHLQLYVNVIKHTNVILGIDGNNVKALYRRAVAKLNRKEYEEAQMDIKRALLLDPKDTGIVRLHKEINHKLLQHRNKTKEVYKHLFSDYD